jgi:ribosomal protein S27AE
LRNDDGQYAAAIERCEMVARSHGHVLGVWQQVDESLHASLCAVCGAMVLVARLAHEERWHAGGRALKQTCLLEED